MIGRLLVLFAVLCATPCAATVSMFVPMAVGDNGIVCGQGSTYDATHPGANYASNGSDGAQRLSRNGPSPSFEICEMYFRYVTAGTIPSQATINSAWLVWDTSLTAIASAESPALSIICENYAVWQYQGLGVGDFQHVVGNDLLDVPLDTVSAGTDMRLPVGSGSVSNLGFVSKTNGVYTAMRCGISARSGDQAPTLLNDVWIYMSDIAGGGQSGGHKLPRLYVDWSPPSGPACCFGGTPGETPTSGGNCPHGAPLYGACWKAIP